MAAGRGAFLASAALGRCALSAATSPRRSLPPDGALCPDPESCLAPWKSLACVELEAWNGYWRTILLHHFRHVQDGMLLCKWNSHSECWIQHYILADSVSVELAILAAEWLVIPHQMQIASCIFTIRLQSEI
ncbi:hypothetical protein GUJ93_ZPchr0006g43770 [Zizania palustris]|uniref:Uncharacterized protein n=1 Tax=Zizania palustris TaxID=103762 RepID=A0A8J5TFS7_ZIZPA|nr:hypothetical protein GUJ93_ZPchr0006g43770 [Zizania palustris]